ncbi:PrsW family glutamic-type intramembrane protease [Streptomyces sp. NPDC005955]|uniref:PrsW family glutamic-type intramembrane protease n=1 Tax=Streptomyces sp. NPDC005955 TaxID=3364738 RepID=UPI0036B67C04
MALTPVHRPTGDDDPSGPARAPAVVPDHPVAAPAPVGPAVPPRAPWWRRRGVRIGALTGVLALCGVVLLALVREQTGNEGFLVGLGLAVLPVPLLVAAFRWLDRVAPRSWRDLGFCFAWGSCAAALISIVANSFATHWIADRTADPDGADTLGATVIAPVVEESAKAAAILLIFLFRRRGLTRLVDGLVVAGVTAIGFAFTENILYLGTAFDTDRSNGDAGLASMTALTFFVRVVMSPFAHPLFTVLTGIGFGLAAQLAPRLRVRRALAPAAGLLLAMGLHALWNGSTTFGDFGFFLVYGAVMVPVFGLLTWLAVWARQHELRILRAELPAYVAAGWLGPPEPVALGSLRARRLALDHARRHGGPTARQAVRAYQQYATALGFLRHRGDRGGAGADFVVRERALLDALWELRRWARPSLAHAAFMTAPRALAHPPHAYPTSYAYPAPYGAPAPYGSAAPPAYGVPAGYGHGYGYPTAYGVPPGQGAPYGHGHPTPYRPYGGPGGPGGPGPYGP